MVNNKIKVNKNIIIFTTITITIILVDQLLKFFIQKYQPNFNLSILNISLIKNTGAGFGILQNQTVILAIISLIVAIIIITQYKKIPPDKISQIIFALFLGGVIGNALDRLFRGYVIDFINFSFWPAFNAADSAISIAAVGMIIYYLKNDYLKNHSKIHH